MTLKMVEPCPHDISDQDVASHADGLCPLCLYADLHRLKLNFRDMERGKRRTDERLKIAITALNMIAKENTRWSEMQHMAREALSRVTADVGGSLK